MLLYAKRGSRARRHAAPPDNPPTTDVAHKSLVASDDLHATPESPAPPDGGFRHTACFGRGATGGLSRGGRLGSRVFHRNGGGHRVDARCQLVLSVAVQRYAPPPRND